MTENRSDPLERAPAQRSYPDWDRLQYIGASARRVEIRNCGLMGLSGSRDSQNVIYTQVFWFT